MANWNSIYTYPISSPVEWMSDLNRYIYFIRSNSPDDIIYAYDTQLDSEAAISDGSSWDSGENFNRYVSSGSGTGGATSFYPVIMYIDGNLYAITSNDNNKYDITPTSPGGTDTNTYYFYRYVSGTTWTKVGSVSHDFTVVSQSGQNLGHSWPAWAFSGTTVYMAWIHNREPRMSLRWADVSNLSSWSSDIVSPAPSFGNHPNIPNFMNVSIEIMGREDILTYPYFILKGTWFGGISYRYAYWMSYSFNGSSLTEEEIYWKTSTAETGDLSYSASMFCDLVYATFEGSVYKYAVGPTFNSSNFKVFSETGTDVTFPSQGFTGSNVQPVEKALAGNYKFAYYNLVGSTLIWSGIEEDYGSDSDQVKKLFLFSDGSVYMTTENDIYIRDEPLSFIVPSEERVWIYKTTDYGLNWSSRGLKT